MSQAGTLLSDLGGSSSPGNDSDLVQQILADMNNAPPNPVVQTHHNISSMSGGMAPPPPMGQRNQAMNAQQDNQAVYPRGADPAVATAHMIGREHPTAADFNNMMMFGGNGGHGPAPYAPLPTAAQPPPAPPQKNWTADAADEFKTPLLVAIVCLLVSLPAVNLLVSHYVPSLLRPGGDFNTYGLVARSLTAGLLFWFLQRVVAPLVVL